jgi:hypothetical protein
VSISSARKVQILTIQFPSRIPVRFLYQLQDIADHLAKISVMVLTQRKSLLSTHDV